MTAQRKTPEGGMVVTTRVEPELARLMRDVEAREGVSPPAQMLRGLRLFFEQKGLLRPRPDLDKRAASLSRELERVKRLKLEPER
jgi:hypothetical protein